MEDDFLAYTRLRIKGLRAEANHLEKLIGEFEAKQDATPLDEKLKRQFDIQRRSAHRMALIRESPYATMRSYRGFLMDAQNAQRAAYAEIKRLRGDAE